MMAQSAIGVVSNVMEYKKPCPTTKTVNVVLKCHKDKFTSYFVLQTEHDSDEH